MLRAMLLVTFLIGSAHADAAVRVLDAVEGGYELRLDQVTFPSISVGQMVIRRCADCEVVVLRTDADTSYAVDGTQRNFEDFVSAADGARNGGDARTPVLVGVFYELESSRVTRVLLNVSPR